MTCHHGCRTYPWVKTFKPYKRVITSTAVWNIMESSKAPKTTRTWMPTMKTGKGENGRGTTGHGCQKAAYMNRILEKTVHSSFSSGSRMLLRWERAARCE